MLWRQDGRQRSLTFENLPAAERFKTLLQDHGSDEALRIIELDEIGRHVPSVTEWLYTHIDNLTGVQPATLGRYRTYVVRDIDPGVRLDAGNCGDGDDDRALGQAARWQRKDHRQQARVSVGRLEHRGKGWSAVVQPVPGSPLATHPGGGDGVSHPGRVSPCA
ncbi:hypothetical protein [Mycobacterium sp. OTB74]|uniref:hypothetical protein n=1 Tax=Mycobacterium sp. OTB74 TaxID=1853452 RepID=UPI002473A7FE|nr:hypothetical protein [Mycobacterium sp. OTB74]